MRRDRASEELRRRSCMQKGARCIASLTPDGFHRRGAAMPDRASPRRLPRRWSAWTMQPRLGGAKCTRPIRWNCSSLVGCRADRCLGRHQRDLNQKPAGLRTHALVALAAALAVAACEAISGEPSGGRRQPGRTGRAHRHRLSRRRSHSADPGDLRVHGLTPAAIWVTALFGAACGIGAIAPWGSALADVRRARRRRADRARRSPTRRRSSGVRKRADTPCERPPALHAPSMSGSTEIAQQR